MSLYSPPNKHLIEVSCGTLVVCRHQENMFTVMDVKLILSVVAMVPFPYLIDGRNDQYFMVEKFGLDVVEVDTLGARGHLPSGYVVSTL